MPSAVRCRGLLALVAMTAIGCGQSPFLSPQQRAALQQQQTPFASQVQELQRRVAELDTSNRDLNAQLAQSEQQAKIFRDQTQLLQQQLGDTVAQLQQAKATQQEAEAKMKTLTASVQKRGGAIITANNSIRNSLSSVDIPGVEVRQEEDVIRIEMPADQLFQRGTVQLAPTAYTYLDTIANAVARAYPRQRIAIEGHTDSGVAFSGVATTNHQLSMLQALAVFDVLTRRNRLPARQMFVQGMGSNFPRASNATEAGQTKNRRIELVIYPQTVD